MEKQNTRLSALVFENTDLLDDWIYYKGINSYAWVILPKSMNSSMNTRMIKSLSEWVTCFTYVLRENERVKTLNKLIICVLTKLI